MPDSSCQISFQQVRDRFFFLRLAHTSATRAALRLEAEVLPGDLALLKFLRILNDFHAQEQRAEHHRSNDETHQPLAQAALGRIHCKRHGQAAANEYDSVEGTKFNAERSAGRAKCGEEAVAIDQ